MKNDINNNNPGSEKKFNFTYQNVETREVTVYAKTIEEAYIKATKTVENRHKTGFVSGFRFDDKFMIRYIYFLTSGFKKFKGLPYGKTMVDDSYRGVLIGPEVLDNNSKAA